MYLRDEKRERTDRQMDYSCLSLVGSVSRNTVKKKDRKKHWFFYFDLLKND